MTTTRKTSQQQIEWKKSACILCSLNCGIEVQIGGPENRDIIKVRGDKDHPTSQGYVCEKTKRLTFYQSGADRISQPQRRKPDGSYESIGWGTAIKEIAEKFSAIKQQYGGESILSYGGGGQGNHLGGTYGDATLKALGVKYRSNALAQEKTGEFWVNGKMLATGVHGDFEHCEVALFIGKNPWQSHGFARARTVIKEMAKDPNRKIIVIDPRRSETAAKADHHLALKPGTDAWCLAALVAIIVQEDLVKHAWVKQHTQGYEEMKSHFINIPISNYAQRCGIDEDTLRTIARIIATAKSVSVFEDLGLQMNRHSTLGSYLQRLLWLLTGNFARKGTNNSPVPFLALNAASKGDVGAKKKSKPQTSTQRIKKVSPVTQSKIIIGLIPCNVISEEILTDHPKRFRAMLIDSGNPVHSFADSQKMREAMRALELSVVIDVAMTETAREADYVLPASSQYEKSECTYFNLEFPHNAFHLRQPLFSPLPGTLPEAEIHSRLVMALGKVTEEDIALPAKAAKYGRITFALAFGALLARKQHLAPYLPVLLYRTLGPQLPKGLADAAVLWGISHLFVQANAKSAANAGFTGFKLHAGEKLFDAIINSPSGVIFSSAKDYNESWDRVGIAGKKINLCIHELFDELDQLATEEDNNPKEFPLILSAGERRSDTSNTVVRNPSANNLKHSGSLRISPQDATSYDIKTGDTVSLTTSRGSAKVVIEISDMMQPGHISLPNGFGMSYSASKKQPVSLGAAPNELTCVKARDPIAGTPWHKYVPAAITKTA